MTLNISAINHKHIVSEYRYRRLVCLVYTVYHAKKTNGDHTVANDWCDNQLVLAISRTTNCLATTLFSQALLETLLFTRLQVKAVLFNVFTDAFALNFTTEATHGFFEGFVFADSY